MSETVVARFAAVEIRRMEPIWAAETCVKGEPDLAYETARRRLESYAAGENPCGTPLRIAWPLVRMEEVPGRWRVRVFLPRVESAFLAAAR